MARTQINNTDFYGMEAIFNYEETANTAGGTATTGSWLKLADSAGTMTSKYNTIPSLSMASAVFTIPAGTYYVDAYHIFYNTQTSSLRLRNLTAPATLVVGSNIYVYPSGNEGTIFCRGYFTIVSQITAELEYNVAATQTTNGLGVAANHTEKELYGQIAFRRLA